MILETENLILETISLDDIDLIFELTNNQLVMKYFPKVLSKDETLELIKKILSQYEKHGYSFWKLIDKDSKIFLGMVGLLNQDIDGKNEIEIGYRILPQFWGKGIATEAASACLEYAKKELLKSRVISLIRPENIPSQGVANKLHAKIEKTVIHGGLKHDVWLY